MKVRLRKPDCSDSAYDATLFNRSGIGLLLLSNDNQTIKTEMISAK